MKEFIKKVPLPASGVMLGFAGLGNLLQSHSETLRIVCGIIAAFLLILVLLKIFMYPALFREDMNNPVMASVFCTFPMALMLLTTYVKPLMPQGAYLLWIAAIALHLMLMIYFTVKFIFRFDLKKVFASYYIVYVGIAIAAVTAPVHDRKEVGEITFWFGIVTLIILFFMITARYVKHVQVPEPAQPLICIYAAPVSLCIAGYVQSVSTKHTAFLLVMLTAATALYIFAIIKAMGFIRRKKFFPSYAAFTFPFVITAIASKMTMGYMAKAGQPMAWLPWLVWLETIVAAVLVVYVFIRYMVFIFGETKKTA